MKLTVYLRDEEIPFIASRDFYDSDKEYEDAVKNFNTQWDAYTPGKRQFWLCRAEKFKHGVPYEKGIKSPYFLATDDKAKKGALEKTLLNAIKSLFPAQQLSA